MSQQYPQGPNQQPQQQYQGGPAPYQPPQEPKKSWVARHKGLTITGGIIGFFVIVGIAAGGGSSENSGTSKPADKPAVAPKAPGKGGDAKPAAKPAEKEQEPAADLSQADQFKAFVAKNGTPAEKAAVKHVTKVQGADKQNDMLDTADIHTDYAGGLMGPHSGEGKLLASAFADWKSSENGLVTVYDKDGQLLSNGNF